MRKPMRLFGLFASLALVCLLAVPYQATAAEVIRNFASFVQIEADGTLLVREEITVVAEHNQINYGIYRDFPLKYTGPKRYSGEVPFEVVSASLDGAALDTSDVQRTRGNIRILMRRKDQKLSRGEHTFVLVYSTSMHVRSFETESYDELNWNVTGDGWAFPIERASCFISLPEGAEILQTIGWTGRHGSKDNPPEIELQTPGSAYFVSSRPVSPGEHFTVAVSFPRGVVIEDIREDPPVVVSPDIGGHSGADTPVYEPSFFDRLAFLLNHGFFRDVFGPLGILALCTVYFAVAWWFFGKDPKPGAIIPLFHPPLAGHYGARVGKTAEDLRESPMSPAAVEYVRNANKLGGRGLASLFLSLAFKNFCRLEKSGKAFTVTVLDPEKSPEDVSAEEGKVYDSLKGDGKKKELKISKDNADTLRKINKEVKGVLSKRYGGIWSHNRGIVLAGWFLVMPLSVYLAHGGHYDGQEVVMPMLLFCLAMTGLCWLCGRGANHLQSRVLRAILVLLYSLGRGLAGWSCAVVVFMVGAGLFTSYNSPSPLLLLFLIPPIIFSRIMKAPSKEGRALLDKIDGLAMYIKTAEKDRLAMLNAPEDSPEVFERLLPYAVALGLEKTWCDRFADQLAAGLIDNRNIPEEAWTSAGLSAFAGDLSRDTGSVSNYTTGDSSGGSAFSSGGGGGGGGGSGRGSGGGGGGGI